MKADEYLASQRSGKLVIVESPAKARTVGRFLGKGYTVRASVGHVRDLLRSSLSVDVENNFTPKYRVPNEKKEVVKELKELARQHSEIYLATDPDREGEAIAWHLMEAAQIEPRLAKRVVFHEITQTAIEDAFSHPREINMDLVNAQQARRVLDRLVGYSISPILWEKVRNRLSAGRVQSVALRLIVEREREIDAFIPVEYWTIAAEFKPQGIRSTYIAKLAKIDAVDPELPDEATVLPIVTDMEAATYSIARIKRGERRRKPLAPFITSTMQQEASRKLGYTARRTMSIAQQLYEGLDVGEGGSTGLITYMRTDSTNIAEVAQKEAREYIQQIYGQSFLPETPPQYKTRAVSAQEAHEAIRPTSVFRSPDKIKQYLTNDQFKLYQLVWQRFLASQMEAAVFDTLSIEIEAKTQIHEYLLRVSGSTVKFPGYLVVYEEAVDEDQKTEEENARIPSGLEEGQRQNLVRVIPEQHFTQPPPRYSEATLVQVLEEYGIGRPSTYAPILSTIQERGYVIREAKRLFPTETGILVNDIMVQHFPSIVDLHFTAHMEADLDQVAAGQEGWTDVVAEFYREFEPVLRRAQEAIPVTKAELEKIGRICPDCGGDLVIRWGRYGKFISCNNFPNCRHTEALLEKIGVKCPNDGGEIVIRKTRKGRIFYGCANYPNCEFTSWKQPIPVPCPKCGGLLVIANKREMQCTKCEETFLVEHVT
ncbi:MAG: type I DNA topoisomerase, partial [Chloroflexi bacterium]|nr:type I DNA topoisomerase [Chloroflexota bacterium]